MMPPSVRLLRARAVLTTAIKTSWPRTRLPTTYVNGVGGVGGVGGIRLKLRLSGGLEPYRAGGWHDQDRFRCVACGACVVMKVALSAVLRIQHRVSQVSWRSAHSLKNDRSFTASTVEHSLRAASTVEHSPGVASVKQLLCDKRCNAIARKFGKGGLLFLFLTLLFLFLAPVRFCATIGRVCLLSTVRSTASGERAEQQAMQPDVRWRSWMATQQKRAILWLSFVHRAKRTTAENNAQLDNGHFYFLCKIRLRSTARR